MYVFLKSEQCSDFLTPNHPLGNMSTYDQKYTYTHNSRYVIHVDILQKYMYLHIVLVSHIDKLINFHQENFGSIDENHYYQGVHICLYSEI